MKNKFTFTFSNKTITKVYSFNKNQKLQMIYNMIYKGWTIEQFLYHLYNIKDTINLLQEENGKILKIKIEEEDE